MKNIYKVVNKASTPITRPLSVVAIIALLATLLSPIVLIWDEWSTCWKTALTGIVVFIVCHFFIKLTRLIFRETYKNEVSYKTTEPKFSEVKKSRFQQRLEEAMKEREKKGI